MSVYLQQSCLVHLSIMCVSSEWKNEQVPFKLQETYLNLDFDCFFELFSNHRRHSCCRWWKLHNTLNHRWSFKVCHKIYILLLSRHIWILFWLLSIYRVSGFCYDTIFYDFTFVSRWGCGDSYPVDFDITSYHLWISGFCYHITLQYVSRWGCGNSYPVDLQPRLWLWGKLSSKVSSVFARASWLHAISSTLRKIVFQSEFVFCKSHLTSCNICILQYLRLRGKWSSKVSPVFEEESFFLPKWIQSLQWTPQSYLMSDCSVDGCIKVLRSP